MKRKWRGIGSILLTLCMVFIMLPGAVFAAEGDEFTVDNLKYKVLTEDTEAKTGTVALVGYPEGNAPTGALTVAEAVYDGGTNYTVTEIGEDAFSLCDGITEVVIGDSVETIGNEAFSWCEGLTAVEMGNSVKTIGDEAFARTNITSINLPASVKVIGEDAFSGCEKLTGFTVNEANSNFFAESGVLYSKDGKKTLILYPAGKTGDSYTIPDSVETIAKRAFAGNNNLKTIDTQNAVTIGEGAFAASALESLTIGDSVVTIGKEAFMYCQGLETITILENSSLETIGDSAFGMCEALNSIELPASLKTIGGGAFGYCHSLESLWIGPLVNAIGTNAFYAEKLADFTVDPANEHYSSADNVLYDRNKTTLIRYMQAKTDTSFSIPATVTKIEKSAFYATYELETVTIPSVVNNIGDSAFYWSGIKSAIFLGDTPPETVGSGIFASCNNLTDIYVPEGSVDAYETALGVDYASMVTAIANHTVTVTNGTASPSSAAAGTTVTITANTAPSGQHFKEWSISPAVTFVEGTSKTDSTAKFSMPAQAVTATATYAGSGSSGGGGGGGTTQPTAPAAGGAVTVNYTASNGTAALSLPAAKVKDIIANSQGGAAVIDLSKVSGVTAASLPKAAISAMNEAGLDVTVKLPAGTIILDEDAAASIVEQATGSNLSIELQPVATGSLTPAQQEAVQSGDIVLDINILSGSQQISSFDGTLSVQVPYNGPQPMAVWYLNDKGDLEKVNCTFQGGIVSFDLDHLSLYVVGQDIKEADKENPITEDKEPGWKNPFTDVKAADWFYGAVQYVNEKGLMAGTGNTTFSPHDNTTRGMIVTILYRLEGTPTVSTTNPFDDVAVGQYYADAVVWAAENQIVSGYGNGKFGPNDSITREQMAVIMMKYAQTKGYDVSARADLAKYSDTGAISDWAKEALSWANTAGLIQGDGSKLNPGGKAQRCQVASILNRFIENIAK